MNTKLSRLLIAVLFFFSVSATYVLAQKNDLTVDKCKVKKLCTPEMYGDFDYSKQTLAAILSPGDKIPASAIIDASNIARILVCADPQLGTVKFRLLEEVEENQPYVIKVNKREEQKEIYKKNSKGEFVLDDWGDKVFEGYETIVQLDTLWGRKLVKREIEVFDSQNNKDGVTYWQENVKVARRLKVEVIVPEGDASVEGCVNLYVGHKSVGKKEFK